MKNKIEKDGKIYEPLDNEQSWFLDYDDNEPMLIDDFIKMLESKKEQGATIMEFSVGTWCNEVTCVELDFTIVREPTKEEIKIQEKATFIKEKRKALRKEIALQSALAKALFDLSLQDSPTYQTTISCIAKMEREDYELTKQSLD